MRKLFGFLLLFAPAILFSQTVQISGDALFFKNEPISVYLLKDALSTDKKLITETIITDDGAYQLSFDIDQAQEIILKIEMREMYIRVHPNSKIELNFLPIKNASNQRNPIRYAIKYDYLPKGKAPDSIYHILNADFANIQEDINKDTRLLNHYNLFFSNTDSIYKPYIQNDSLFTIYYQYFKAKAFLQTSASRKQLIANNIIGQPIHYKSEQYLSFFKFTMNTELHFFFSKNNKELDLAKKEYRIYDALMELLSTDSLLGNEESRSLALMLFTKSNSSNVYFDQQLKTAIINQLANFCPYSEQSDAALSYQSTSQDLQKNQEAPIFELLGSKDEMVALNSFRGKPVYLGFIHSNSSTCQKDLLAIEKLKKKFRKALFVMVICDRDSIIFDQLPKESSNLRYLYLNKDYSVLEKYQIWNFPIYYLLDKHGYFIASPAQSPVQMFEPFTVMFAPKSRRKSYEIIKN